MPHVAADMEDTFALAARAGLEGDGVASRLFEILWKRDLLSDSALALRIPDTVIFKYDAPSLWYFTSVDGTIKKKTKAKVTPEHIEQAFLKKASASGIVAYYVATGSTQQNIFDSDETDGDGSERMQNDAAGTKTTVEYLDREGLHDFLFGRHRNRSDGILQKFMEPTGDCNNMVRALWSPKVCLLERRVNNRRLNDTRYDMYERAVTFEGPDFHSSITPVRGNSLMHKVHGVADAIVEHVAAVTNDRICVSRMALNFKIDHKDRLYLLFASSVRLRDELKRSQKIGSPNVADFVKQGFLNTPLELKTCLGVPEHVRRIGSMAGRPVALQKTWCCPTCEEKVEAGNLFEISYKNLMESQDSRAGEVPAVLQHLHPRLTVEEYDTLKEDVAFLHKAAAVCEDCYLRYSASQLGPRPDCESQVTEEETFIGTGNRNPERLRQRQTATRRRIEEHTMIEEGFEEEYWKQKAREAEGMRPRAKSCPKLPSWGPNHDGAVAWPPAPVLSRCRSVVAPAPPSEAPAPGLAAARLTASVSAASRPPRQRPISDAYSSEQKPRANLPPLKKGTPYLKGLQDFAKNNGARAEYILPQAFAQFKSAGVGQQRPAPARVPITETRAVGPHLETPSESAPAAPAVVETSAVASASPQGPSWPAMAASYAASSASPERRSATPNSAQDSAHPSLDDLDDDVLDDDGGEDPSALVGYVGKPWWPSSRGSSAGNRASTPTTRPPSQGDTGPPSSLGGSRPSSRPSTRNSSRLQSAVRTPQSAILGAAPNRPPLARPRSSPQLSGASRQHSVPASEWFGVPAMVERSPQERVDAAYASGRPQSSPQLRSRRPPTPGGL